MSLASEVKTVQQREDVQSGKVASLEQAYADALEKKVLPGYALIAGDKDGNILYSKAAGFTSLDKETAQPFSLDTICWIASMTKLLTSVACLQAVEAGLLTLDAPVEPILPEIAKYGLITGFDDAKNKGIYEQLMTKITLRMLLTHTSGHEYDWFSPLLLKWRRSRNEAPTSGPTIEQKFSLPLVFEPGTGFSYGGSTDWAGKMLERVTGTSLEHFMTERIFKPLGITDIAFFLKDRPDMRGRLATMSTHGNAGSGPLVDVEDFDASFGGRDCSGGAGAFASARGYFPFLQAVMRRDARLMGAASFEELFRPQLDGRCKEALNEYVQSTPMHAQFVGMNLRREIRKTWSFAGMVCEEGEEGRMSEGTYCWGGMPSLTWYMDVKAGICGVAFCQVLPPMFPGVLQLHTEFQKAMYKIFAKVD